MGLKQILKFGFLYWLLAAVFYFYQYVLRVSTGVLTDNLMQEFSITASTIGTIMGLSSVSYVVMQIPAGSSVDYFGLKRLLPGAILICGLGILLFATSHDLTTLLISRVLLGGACAFAFVSCTKIISMYFSKERMAIMVSATILIGSSGGIVGQGPLATLIHAYGWREILTWVAVLGFGLAAILYCVARKSKETAPTSGGEKDSLTMGIKTALKSPQILLVCAWGFCIYMPLCVFADSWGTPYLMSALGCSKIDAAHHVSFIYWGVLGGCGFYGWLGTKYPNYRIIFMTSTFLLLLLFVGMLWHIHVFVDSLDTVFLCMGFLNSVQLLMFPAAAAWAPRKYTGSVMGVVNTATMASGALFQKITGLGLDYFWDGRMHNGIPHYTTSCYQVPLSIILVNLTMGIVFAAFLKKNKQVV